MRRKQFLRLAGITLGGVALAPMLVACGGGDDPVVNAAVPTPVEPVPVPVVVTDLSAEEIAGLLFMREEEKLAHDVYVALYALWNATVFDNIAQSESAHTEAIRQLILAHGLEDPAATTAAGVFQDADLQKLYDDLVAMGTPSLIEALKVGCLIEEKDIKDINDKKALVFDEPDIVQVYDNLLCGSRNHLRAFNSRLITEGDTYTPSILTQAEWDAIADSAQEQCGG